MLSIDFSYKNSKGTKLKVAAEKSLANTVNPYSAETLETCKLRVYRLLQNFNISHEIAG